MRSVVGGNEGMACSGVQTREALGLLPGVLVVLLRAGTAVPTLRGGCDGTHGGVLLHHAPATWAARSQDMAELSAISFSADHELGWAGPGFVVLQHGNRSKSCPLRDMAER